MPTRRTQNPDAPLSQEKYLSSPEYAELRGISGGAVAPKAMLQEDRSIRSLLFFIQALSLREGGVKRLVNDLMAEFPDRIGTPTMRKRKLTADSIVDHDTALAIERELGLVRDDRSNTIEDLLYTGEDVATEKHCPRARDPEVSERPVKRGRWAVKPYLIRCQANVRRFMEEFLMDLCINPKLQITRKAGAWGWNQKVWLGVEHDQPEFTADLEFFSGVIEALLIYQDRHSQRVREQFAETEVSRQIFRELDFSLKTGLLVIVDGKEGIGKSVSFRAWTNMHLGEARMITLNGITTRTTFFRAIAKECGLASSVSRTANEMQGRVTDFLHLTRMMLIVDEAHFVFPQGKRVYTAPELIEWLRTHLNDFKVPVVLSTTPQFSKEARKCSEQLNWNLKQFMRRVRHYRTLPERHKPEDLALVAKKLLPGAGATTVKLLVGFAGAIEHQLDAMVDLVREAKQIAIEEGREVVGYSDVKKAIETEIVPMMEAKQAAFDPRQKPARGRPRGPRANPVHEHYTGDSERDLKPRIGAADDLPEAESGEHLARRDTALSLAGYGFAKG